MPPTPPGPAAPDALAEVFVRHRGSVRAVLRRLGVVDENLDDAVQDVFVVFVRRVEDYEPSGSVGAWLRGIARRVAGNYRRSHGRRRRLLEALPAPDREPSPEEVAARSEAAGILEGFLAGLRPELCEVYVLSEVHGLTGPEIARTLGINLNTAYTRLRAARQELDRAVERVSTRDRRTAGALLPLVPRLALGAASASAMIALPAVVLVVSLIGNLYVLSRRTSPHDETTATPTCPEHEPSGSVVAPPTAECEARSTTCTAQVRDCRAQLATCDQTRRRELPWPIRFDEEEPNPEAELALQPLLDRVFRSQAGVEIEVECRGPLCRLDVTLLDTAYRSIHRGELMDPFVQMQSDAWFEENIEGAAFEAALPSTDIIRSEGVWLSTTWLSWDEGAVP